LVPPFVVFEVALPGLTEPHHAQPSLTWPSRAPPLNQIISLLIHAFNLLSFVQFESCHAKPSLAAPGHASLSRTEPRRALPLN